MISELVEREKQRREEIREAVAAVVGPGTADDAFTLNQLRRHIAKYYGDEIAYTATPADLWGLVAKAGAQPTHFGAVGVLRNPSREALKKIRDKWNDLLPPPELPMIRRRVGPSVESENPDSFPDSPGTLFSSHGKWRQYPDPATIDVWTRGGHAKRGGPSHKTRRRFPSYVAQLRAFLDADTGVVSAVDRQILEFIIDGHTIRWIADELGMKRPTVHKRVRQLRLTAGIPGPGSGR